MKETHGKGFEVTHRYDMRSIKTKLSTDHNKSIIDEEQGLKDRCKKKILIKPKVEHDEGVDVSHHMQILKQQTQNLKQ
jgi:hypothetical protein